ncbi:hypothetical protein SteCoe_17051 [Stentor coeruleus]|uniref:Uncharacterized protein n=1 Tax=Stentor coeruleus TaxID=5963 RepID=A0A1R2BZV0_9CILI|nr:hypothetical protein SteCoe_17051 [Stentor coeruleus]
MVAGANILYFSALIVLVLGEYQQVSFLSQFSKSEDIDASVPEEFQDDTELVESVNDVDEMLTDLLGTGIYDMDNYPDGMLEVDDVEAALDEDQYILVDNVVYDSETIAQAQADSEALHDDKLEALSITEKIVTTAIEALETFYSSEEADDGDLDSLETELDLWDDLAEAMEETDTVVVLEEEYTYEEIIEIIEELEAEIAELSF